MANPIQTRFDGGEQSERMGGRFDSESHKKSLALCSNFEPTPQGSLRMRAGSDFLWKLLGAKRMIYLRTASTKEYLAVLLDHAMRLYNISAGTLTEELVAIRQMVVNGSFAAGSAGWLTRGAFSSANFSGARVLVPKDGLIYQKITVPVPWKSAVIRQRFYGVEASSNNYPVMKLSSTDPAAWTLKTANAGSGGADIPNTTEGRYDGGGDIRQVKFPLNPNGVWLRTTGDGAHAAGDYWISYEPDYANSGAAAYTDTSEPFYVDDVEVEITAQDGQTFSIVTPWSEAELDTVQFCTETGRDRTIFVHELHQPWAIFFKRTGVWEFDPITFGPLPEKWGDNTGEGGAPNWPAAVEVDNGRAIYGGEPEQKNRVVASKSGAPDNFTQASGESGAVLPGDAIDFKLATKGAIKWIKGSRTTLVGTDIEERSIFGSKGLMLAGDVQTKRESAFGSAAIPAVDAGMFALYVSGDRRKIRALAYAQDSNGWDSKDLTFVAEHITEDLVKELHHVFTPDAVAVAVMESGKLVLCTFEPKEGICAFWRASITGGNVISAAPSPGPVGAFMWMIVERNGEECIEKLSLSEVSTMSRQYVDSGKTFADVAEGADLAMAHLPDGTAVRVLVDGALYEDQVIAGGKVQAPAAGALAVVGLGFRAKGVTLPRNIHGSKAQSAKLGVILNKSALPLLNGKRPADRTPSTAMNTPEALRTGKFTLGNRGWSDEDKITIEQDLPFRTEVLALFSTTDVGE